MNHDNRKSDIILFQFLIPFALGVVIGSIALGVWVIVWVWGIA